MAGRLPDSGYIDFAEIFRRVQTEMLAHLSVGGMFEHSTTHGHATEQQWLQLLRSYLPSAYRAAPAFIVNAQGLRSEQIDIAIFDGLYASPLFPHASSIHIPVESVYAIFEVKTSLNGPQLKYAGSKAQSVRKLYPRRDNRILAGILATTSDWKPESFAGHVQKAVSKLPKAQKLDLGCALDRGGFEHDRKVHVSEKDDALIFFTLRLIDRLSSLGPPPAVDMMKYVSTLKSFRRSGD